MKILFTGASSFTGYWFVKTAAAAGHELICPLRGAGDHYDGVRKTRFEKLKPLGRLVPNTPFGSDAFLKLARDEKFDVLCHHAAETANYKSADFDVNAALQNNTLNLRQILAAMKGALKAVLLTGSVFENDEGKGDEPLRAFSGYGLSKGLAWQVFRYHCAEAQVPLGKFVIPNPFGPFEEPRFTAYLMRMWKEGKPAGVKTPDYLRDNIHVDLMALAYAKFLGHVTAMKSGEARLNPSGYVETQGEFAQRVAKEVRQRTGWECKLELSRQEDFSEPLRRVNKDAVTSQFPNWNEKLAWDAFVGVYSGS
ncbi:MAG TPA: NAD(P)-dependent oxidoreductase [Verrucomicrobiae bacterium]|jgi:nucleoside-diphosphate-sugar epimerase